MFGFTRDLKVVSPGLVAVAVRMKYKFKLDYFFSGLLFCDGRTVQVPMISIRDSELNICGLLTTVPLAGTIPLTRHDSESESEIDCDDAPNFPLGQMISFSLSVLIGRV